MNTYRITFENQTTVRLQAVDYPTALHYGDVVAGQRQTEVAKVELA